MANDGNINRPSGNVIRVTSIEELEKVLGQITEENLRKFSEQLFNNKELNIENQVIIKDTIIDNMKYSSSNEVYDALSSAISSGDMGSSYGTSSYDGAGLSSTPPTMSSDTSSDDYLDDSDEGGYMEEPDSIDEPVEDYDPIQMNQQPDEVEGSTEEPEVNEEGPAPYNDYFNDRNRDKMPKDNSPEPDQANAENPGENPNNKKKDNKAPIAGQDPNNKPNGGSSRRNTGNRFKNPNLPGNQTAGAPGQHTNGLRKPGGTSGLPKAHTPGLGMANRGSGLPKLGGASKSAGGVGGKAAGAGNKAAKAGADAAKKAAANTAKAITKVGGKIATFIASNPVVLIIIGICAAVLLLMLLVLFLVSGDGSSTSTSGTKGTYSCSVKTQTSLDVTKTSLSRDDFIELVNNYDPGNSSYAVFKENAGLIYDLGVEYQINPELVIIRSKIEGYAPGSSHNNYWGINCENGHPEKCTSYSSFEQGVIGFYNTIKKYNTNDIYEVMNNYVYIGEKWFSPGSESLGGCYYYKYIEKYLSPERSAEVKASCESGSQIATTKEDQDAYVKYQVETETMPLRKKIFNLGDDASPVCASKSVIINPVPSDTSSGIMNATQVNAGTFLAQNGSSVKEFNDKLLETVKKDGIGTRQAVVDSAMLLINTFGAYGIKLPYSYLGGWGSGYTDKSGNNHNFYSTSLYGLNPYFGEEIYVGDTFGYTYKKTYYYLGFDCSGFVTWALTNGGVDHPIVRATDYKTTGNVKKYPAQCVKTGNGCSYSDVYVAQPGDVFSNSHHVVLVLKYEESNERYIVAEAGGKDLGVLIKTRSLDSLKKNGYYAVDMTDYYENHVNKNYEQNFQSNRKDTGFTPTVTYSLAQGFKGGIK